MSKKLDVVGVGYPSIDHIIFLEKKPEIGETSIIMNDNNQTPYFGGCAVNVTYLLSHFGYQCGLVMIVGNDFESSGFGDFLREKNISLEFILHDFELKTSYTTLLTSPTGEHMTLFYPGPMSEKECVPYNLSCIVSKFGLITIGNLEGNKQFLAECIKKNIPIIFSMKGDFSSVGKEYLTTVFENSELIFMNELEKVALDSYLPNPVLSYLNKKKIVAIIVTNGSNGSTVYARKKVFSIPAVKIKNAKDTAGGGDAYIAGFLKEYLGGCRNFKECGISGAVLSSFIIEEYGCLTNVPDVVKFEDRKNKIIKEC